MQLKLNKFALLSACAGKLCTVHTRPPTLIVIARVFASMTRVPLTSTEWTMMRGKRGEGILADGVRRRRSPLWRGTISPCLRVFPPRVHTSRQSRNRTPSGRIVGSQLVSPLSSLLLKIAQDRFTWTAHILLDHVRQLVFGSSVSNRFIHTSGTTGDFWTARSFREIPTGRRVRSLKILERTRRGILENLRNPYQRGYLTG